MTSFDKLQTGLFVGSCEDFVEADGFVEETQKVCQKLAWIRFGDSGMCDRCRIPGTVAWE